MLQRNGARLRVPAAHMRRAVGKTQGRRAGTRMRHAHRHGALAAARKPALRPERPPAPAPPQGTKNCAVQSQPGAARGPAPPRRRAAGPHGRSEPPVPPAPPAPPFAAVRSPASARARSLTQRRSRWIGFEPRNTPNSSEHLFFFFCAEPLLVRGHTSVTLRSPARQHGATAREPPGGAGTRGRGGRVRLCGQLDTLPGDAPLPLLPALARRKRAAAGSALRTARAEHGLDRDGSPITAAVRGQRRCGAPDRVHVGSRRLARRGTRG